MTTTTAALREEVISELLSAGVNAVAWDRLGDYEYIAILDLGTASPKARFICSMAEYEDDSAGARGICRRILKALAQTI